MEIKVIDDKSLVRETNSNAILAADIESLNRNRAIIRAQEADKEKILTLEQRIEKLEQLFKLNSSIE